MHPKLLELLRDDGITCDLEVGGGSAGVLTREDSNGAHSKDDADRIRLRKLKVGETNDTDPSGWIELAVTNTIRTGQDAKLKLLIHDWRALRQRVGAGVFTGALTLTLQNRMLHNNEKLRIRQPLTVVIAGSRLVPDERKDAGTKTVRVGTRLTTRTVIESVEPDDATAANELDAGWWLLLTEEKHDRDAGDTVLLRLPLPIRETKDKSNILFRVPQNGGMHCWDTIEEVPELGYRRIDYWKDELILQHRPNRGADLSKWGHVRIHRDEILTYLPACFKPGTLREEVFWDRRSATDNPDRALPGRAPRRASSFKVLSGLRASTEMPVTGEKFWVWAVIDLGSDPGKRPALEEALCALVWNEDVTTKGRTLVDTIRLVKQADNPAEPNIVRYLGVHQFQKEQTGSYKIKLFTGDEEQARSASSEQECAVPPKELVLALGNAELSLEVTLDGEPESPRFTSEHPLKAFVGKVPFWPWFEPEFSAPGYDNERSEEGRWVLTKQAMSFQWPSAPKNETIDLRFQGVFRNQTRDSLQPTELGPKHNNNPPEPHVAVMGWVGKSEQNAASPKEVPEQEIIGLKPGADSRQVFDLRVDLEKFSDAQLEEARSSDRNRWPLVARFAMVKLDSGGKPVGRVFSRRVEVLVESFWDELLYVLWSDEVVFGGLILAVLAGIVVRSRRKKARKARVAKALQALEERPQHTAGGEADYGAVLDPMPAAHGRDELMAPSSPQSTQAPSTSPAPSEPSYLDDPRPGGGDAGPSYLD